MHISLSQTCEKLFLSLTLQYNPLGALKNIDPWVQLLHTTYSNLVDLAGAQESTIFLRILLVILIHSQL